MAYKKDIVVFNMPGLGNFIQDFDKNYPQSNINLDTFKSPDVKFQEYFGFSLESILTQKLNQIHKSHILLSFISSLYLYFLKKVTNLVFLSLTLVFGIILIQFTALSLYLIIIKNINSEAITLPYRKIPINKCRRNERNRKSPLELHSSN